MPIGALAGPLIGLGSSLLGGLLGNKKSARTNTSSFNQNSNSTTQGLLTSGQQHLNKAALNALLGLIQNGPQVMQSDRNALRTNINNTYNSLIPSMEAQLTARGFGNSGKVGANLRNFEIQRANAFQTGEQDLMHDAMNRWLGAIGMSKQFLTPYTTTTTNQASGTSEGTGPSQLGNIIGNAGNNFGTAIWLRQLLGGGGSSNPFAGASASGSGSSDDIDWSSIGI